MTSTTTFSVSGSVTSAGQPLAGVVVSDGTRSATTSTSGAYTITGVPNGTYTLTPQREGFTFTPATLSVTVERCQPHRSQFHGRGHTDEPDPAGALRFRQ